MRSLMRELPPRELFIFIELVDLILVSSVPCSASVKASFASRGVTGSACSANSVHSRTHSSYASSDFICGGCDVRHLFLYILPETFFMGFMMSSQMSLYVQPKSKLSCV